MDLTWAFKGTKAFLGKLCVAVRVLVLGRHRLTFWGGLGDPQGRKGRKVSRSSFLEPHPGGALLLALGAREGLADALGMPLCRGDLLSLWPQSAE